MNIRHILLFALLLLLTVPLAQPVRGAGSGPSFEVQEHVALSARYSIFDLSVPEPVSISVNVTFPTASAGPSLVTILTFINPESQNSSATLAPPASAESLVPVLTAPARVVNPWRIVYTVPPNTLSASFLVVGSYTGSSILWKDQTQVAPVSVVLTYQGQSIYPQYSLVISHSGSIDVKKISAPGLRLSTSVSANTVSLVSDVFYPDFIVLLYQPTIWDSAAWALIALGVVFLLLLPSRRFREKLPTGFSSLARIVQPFRRAWSSLKRMDSHKFLTVYVIISVLMLSLSFAAGPDPRVKVFVIASDATTALVKTEMQQSLGNVQILTPSDTESEFNTMATLGTVQVVVVSDYNKLDIPSVEKYIINSLDLVPLVVVVGNDRTALANYTDSLYNGTSLNSGTPPIYVSSPSGLGTPQFRADVLRVIRPNSMGLEVSLSSFFVVAAIVAVLSFLLVTFGIAFLVSKLIEVGEKPLVSSLVEGIFYSAGVFFFTQAVYMTSSALLGWPLGLHAVTSGSSQVTVLGLFHLGAGNQPRTLAALVGLAIGAAPALWSKIDRYVALAICVFAFFVVIDPLTGGTVFFEFVVMLTGGPQIGFANASLISIKTFLNQIGTDAAGWASGNFGISSGEMFYYFGAVPFALIPKLQKSTRTLVLLLCGFAASDGIVRVAEMTAYKTAPSMIAGVMAGLVIAVALLSLSRLEGFVRRYFPSKR
ncbi:MAG TPA: hypothetical protein VEC02_02765 [Nitrososphaerales archaeon]|nr:hypothetical protein [Nitrososphaerales archaeon]